MALVATLAFGLVRPAAAVPPSEFARRALERAALIDLRLQTRPTTVDYEFAAWALEVVADLAPNDAELWRRIIAAQFNAGQVDRIAPSTERLVRADPGDTVATLRLINLAISRQQTAEGRVALYDNFLGPRGDSLDASVRARLALDAALLVREQGDDEGFRTRLLQATELDPSNKDAATLAADTFGAVLDPVERFRWLTRLLYADPLDPQTHRRLAEVLATEGANEQAYRFYSVMSEIEARTQVPTNALRELFRFQFVWRGAGPGEVVRQLNVELDSMRARQQLAFQREVESQLTLVDLDEQFDPTSVRLPLNYEQVRVLAADADEDFLTTQRAVIDLVRTSEDAAAALEGRRVDATDPGQQAAIAARQWELLLNAQRLRAWTGVGLSEAERELERIQENAPGVLRNDLLEIRAWLELHRGNTGRAFDLTAGRDPEELSLNLRTLRAAALETERRFEQAADEFRSAGRASPDWFLRLYLERRARRIDPDINLEGERRAELVSLASAIPSWLDALPEDPSRFVTLRVEPVETVIAPGEPSLVRITLRNIAPIALQLGPNQPINSNFVLIPAVDARRAGLIGLPRPEVVEMDRRLRLARGESVEAVVPADLGITGWLFGLHADTRIDHRWRVVQGFVIDGQGQLVAGPGAIASETDRVVRSITRVGTDQDPRPLPERVRAAGADELVALGLLTRSILLRDLPRDDATGTDELIVAAWGDRYRQAVDDDERAAILMALPHARLAPALAGFDELVRADTLERMAGDGITPALAVAVILTRPGEPDGDTLSIMSASADMRVSALAAIQSARLAAGARAVATATEAWDGLVGASLHSVEP